jgi:hypothetical protein
LEEQARGDLVPKRRRFWGRGKRRRAVNGSEGTKERSPSRPPKTARQPRPEMKSGGGNQKSGGVGGSRIPYLQCGAAAGSSDLAGDLPAGRGSSANGFFAGRGRRAGIHGGGRAASAAPCGRQPIRGWPSTWREVSVRTARGPQVRETLSSCVQEAPPPRPGGAARKRSTGAPAAETPPALIARGEASTRAETLATVTWRVPRWEKRREEKRREEKGV